MLIVPFSPVSILDRDFIDSPKAKQEVPNASSFLLPRISSIHPFCRGKDLLSLDNPSPALHREFMAESLTNTSPFLPVRTEDMSFTDSANALQDSPNLEKSVVPKPISSPIPERKSAFVSVRIISAKFLADCTDSGFMVFKVSKNGVTPSPNVLS